MIVLFLMRFLVFAMLLLADLLSLCYLIIILLFIDRLKYVENSIWIKKIVYLAF